MQESNAGRIETRKRDDAYMGDVPVV